MHGHGMIVRKDLLSGKRRTPSSQAFQIVINTFPTPLHSFASSKSKEGNDAACLHPSYARGAMCTA